MSKGTKLTATDIRRAWAKLDGEMARAFTPFLNPHVQKLYDWAVHHPEAWDLKAPAELKDNPKVKKWMKTAKAKIIEQMKKELKEAS